MTQPFSARRRRAYLAGGGLAVAGWAVGATRLAGLWPARLPYRDMLGLVPFGALDMAWAQSRAALVLSGMDGPAPADAAQVTRIAADRADPCTALFGPASDPRLPIAFFSDFNCPNGRVPDAIPGPDAAQIIADEIALPIPMGAKT